MNNEAAREEYMREIKNTISKYYDDVFIKYYSDQSKQITYGQFADRSKKIEAIIKGMDVRVGRYRIALISEMIPEALMVLLASVYADTSVTVIDSKLPVMMIREMLVETECSAVFVGIDNEELIGYCKERYRVYSLVQDRWITGMRKLNSSETSNVTNDEMAVLFSSGTTEKCKGVAIGYRQQLCSARRQSIIFRSGMKYLFCFPLHHISGFSTFWGSFFSGSIIGIVKEINGKWLTKGFLEFQPELFGMVPKVYEIYKNKCEDYFRQMGKIQNSCVQAGLKICGFFRTYFHLNLGRKLFSKVRCRVFGQDMQYMGVGGGILNQDVYTFFYNMGFKWINIYASTELNIPISFTNGENNPVCTVGKVNCSPQIQIKIQRENDEKAGEILVKTPSIFLKYINSISDTKSIDTEGYFRTGDIGYIDNHGYLRITGRIKESIHLKNGEKVSPESLEQIYKSELRGREYTFLGIEENGKGYDNICLVIEGNIPLEKQYAVERNINKKKSIFTIDEVCFVDKIPRTANGKVKRSELKGQIADNKINRREEPRTIEDKVAAFFKEKYNEIKDETLASMGMDSLEVMEFYAWICDEFYVDALEMMHQGMTVEEIVKFIYTNSKKKIVKKSLQTNMTFYKMMRNCIKPLVVLIYRPIYINDIDIDNDVSIIYAPNHRKTIDSIVLAASIKAQIHWVALKRFFDGEDSIFGNNKNIILRKLTQIIFKNAQMVPIDREGDNSQSMAQLRRYVMQSENVGIFPEGTTNKNPEKSQLGDIKKGAFSLAKNGDAYILPIAITWHSSRKHRVIVNYRKLIRPEKGDTIELLMKKWESEILIGIDENEKIAECGCTKSCRV